MGGISTRGVSIFGKHTQPLSRRSARANFMHIGQHLASPRFSRVRSTKLNYNISAMLYYFQLPKTPYTFQKADKRELQDVLIDIPRASWEPRDHIFSEQLLLDWQGTQARQAQGLEQSFDVDQWKERRAELEAAKKKEEAEQRARHGGN